MHVGKMQVFLPTVGAQVQGELICLSRKQTLHSCSSQQMAMKKLPFVYRRSRFFQLPGFFFLLFKVINL